MGSEQDFFGDVEGVLHITRRVIFWQIHPLKVIIILFNLISIDNLEAHAQENIFNFLRGLGQHMAIAQGNFTTWHGHIQAFGFQFGLNHCSLYDFSLLLKGLGQDIPNFIDLLADNGSQLIGQVFEPFQQLGQGTLFPQDCYPQVLQFLLVVPLHFLQFCLGGDLQVF